MSRNEQDLGYSNSSLAKKLKSGGLLPVLHPLPTSVFGAICFIRMSTKIRQFVRRSIARTKGHYVLSDEETLGFQHRYMHLHRPSRVTTYLLLIDLMVLGLLVYCLEPLISLLLRNEELFGPRFTPSRNNNATSEAWSFQHRTNIPRILHQTSATELLPKEWVYPQNTCKDTYSDFEYKVRTVCQ